jgi:hypothetical protein
MTNDGHPSDQPSDQPSDPGAAVSLADRPRALIDGSNVAHSTEGTAARLANILLVRDKLAERGFVPIIVTDAALRHQIDDVASYERMVDEGAIRQAPAGTDADYFLLSFAKALDASLVSNDRFRDRGRQFADVRRQIIRFMILADQVVFERRTGRREHGADSRPHQETPGRSRSNASMPRRRPPHGGQSGG